jgi:hypothetical protein
MKKRRRSERTVTGKIRHFSSVAEFELNYHSSFAGPLFMPPRTEDLYFFLLGSRGGERAIQYFYYKTIFKDITIGTIED